MIDVCAYHLNAIMLFKNKLSATKYFTFKRILRHKMRKDSICGWEVDDTDECLSQILFTNIENAYETHMARE